MDTHLHTRMSSTKYRGRASVQKPLATLVMTSPGVVKEELIVEAHGSGATILAGDFVGFACVLLFNPQISSFVFTLTL